jgi:hypothetical protein
METNHLPGISPELMAELREAARRSASGVRDPEVVRQACERMDRLREENRQKFGVQDIGVQIIRKTRDPQ